MPICRTGSKHYALIIVTAIALLAFFLRVLYLDQKSLWWDESITLNRIQRGLAFVLTNQMKWGDNVWLDNHPPLSYLLFYFFSQVAGTGDFALRYPAVAWGVLLTVLLYAAGSRLISKPVGLWAALIGALSPFYIWFSQEARMHILVPLLGLLSAYLLWQLLDGKRWPWHAAFVLVNMALLYTNILALSLLLFEGLTVVVHWLKRRDWKLVLTFAVVSLSSSPIIWFGLFRSGRSIREEMLPFSLIFKDVLDSYSAGFSFNAPDLRWYDWAFFALFVLGMLVLVERDRSERVRRALFLGGYVLVTFFVLVIVPPINLHYMGARYAVIGSPAFYLLLATGLETLRTRAKWVFAPAFALVLAIFGISTYRYFFVPPYTQDRGHDYRSAAEFVNALAYPTDAIVGSPFSYDAFYRYSDPRLPWHGLPRVTQWDQETFDQQTAPELASLVVQHDRIWFIDADYLYVEQNRGVTKQWFDENCVRFVTEPFAYVSVVGYLTNSPSLEDWPKLGTPLDVAFEDVLSVQSYGLDDPQPQSGEKTRITLYMESRRDLDADYGIAIRLRDRQGLVWSNWSGPILAGIEPTSHWETGERFKEGYYLKVEPGTPPGVYQVELGAYLVSPYRDLIAYDRNGATLGASVPLTELVVRPREGQWPPQVVSPQQKLDARLGSEIDLIGLDAAERQVQAGDLVPLTMYYQARSDVESDLMVRFLLLDTRGNTVWTTESELVSATYPTVQWRQGELLRGIQKFFVPPHIATGRYRLAIQIVGREGERYAVHEPKWNPWPRSKLALLGLEVSERQYSVELPPISVPLQVGVGDWGQLLGYDLDQSALSPGETLRFTLYWMANRPVTKDYKVFVHVVSQDGQMGAQSDSGPANWSRPTYTWAPGEPIIDAHQVPLRTDLPAGVYEVLIGLYEEQTGQRVLLADQESGSRDHLQLTSLKVQ